MRATLLLVAANYFCCYAFAGQSAWDRLLHRKPVSKVVDNLFRRAIARGSALVLLVREGRIIDYYEIKHVVFKGGISLNFEREKKRTNPYWVAHSRYDAKRLSPVKILKEAILTLHFGKGKPHDEVVALTKDKLSLAVASATLGEEESDKLIWFDNNVGKIPDIASYPLFSLEYEEFLQQKFTAIKSKLRSMRHRYQVLQEEEIAYP